MRQRSTRAGLPENERFTPSTWPEMEEHHALPPHEAMYAKLREANKYETHAGVWKRRLFRKLFRMDPRRDQASLDKFLGEDPLWKGLVADQQFANREAQMYALVAIWEAQNRTNHLLSKICDELHDLNMTSKIS
jgi:hypothetical protein